MVKLVAARQATLPATQGHHAHAALLEIVRAVDPTLAADLHSLTGRKPFTVGPLRGTRPAGRGRVEVLPGQTVTLRFTLLDPLLFQLFLHRFLDGRFRPEIHLGAADLMVMEVINTPESHPWAGFSSRDMSGPAFS